MFANYREQIEAQIEAFIAGLGSIIVHELGSE